MKPLLRWLGLVLLAGFALQLFFLLRIASMAAIDPESTTFQRSEAWRIATGRDRFRWRQQWLPYAQISEHLKRAVIASEDGSFVNHDGVDWDAVEKAWERNAKAEEQAARRAALVRPVARPPKVIGGSTITQQLAKNLLLSGERTLLRKGQEFVLTFALERMLSKRRILEIYLNNVEWGEGVFGAEAAAQHYFRKSASKLGPYEAARLAVMLPQPKRFEKNPGSGYLASRASTIVARMRDAVVP
ncbi:MAG: putative monofunctional peptidoglycan glycosyltransferase, Glycosyltransferase Family 51 [Ramlibacter sp.]|uniref:monofunctional biosynthetic peptidoglycan transglycosylase n=1 Tax=Ramlibacter sp. TaxID=1917967 RepID=UPI00261BB6A3|nr:monofunctional biosynthetic peptidoglycan transglycosylase [Ramlibacter sp.]MDB5752661.1 putative monofunctional peptidoglycan glycosyltransferase, Glycosyltransferase Family 51 [Ramlibacter sp.]